MQTEKLKESCSCGISTDCLRGWSALRNSILTAVQNVYLDPFHLVTFVSFSFITSKKVFHKMKMTKSSEI